MFMLTVCDVRVAYSKLICTCVCTNSIESYQGDEMGFHQNGCAFLASTTHHNNIELKKNTNNTHPFAFIAFQNSIFNAQYFRLEMIALRLLSVQKFAIVWADGAKNVSINCKFGLNLNELLTGIVGNGLLSIAITK